MFSTVLDCRQSLSEVSLCFLSTWLQGQGLSYTVFVRQRSKDINSDFKLISEGFDKCEVIPDHQGPTKLKLVFLLGL